MSDTTERSSWKMRPTAKEKGALPSGVSGRALAGQRHQTHLRQFSADGDSGSDGVDFGCLPGGDAALQIGLVLAIVDDEQGSLEQTGKTGGLEERAARLGRTDDDALD